MKKTKKLAYLPMAVDIIHPGHLNIIRSAEKLGATVMVGCYSDEAIASYKRLPFMPYEQRKDVVENIKGVDIVVKQETRDLEDNLRKYKPDYVVHGTDWQDGALSKARERTLAILCEWGGELIEPEYTEGISSTMAHEHLKEIGVTPLVRQSRLRKLLNIKHHLRGIEVHNGLSAIVAENAILKKSGEPTQEYDTLWLDSLTSSLMKGMLNIEAVDFAARLTIINDIFHITTKSLIFDGRTGGTIEQLTYTIKTLERIGVSAIVISEHDDINSFCEKIKMAKRTQIDRHFMIISKINISDSNIENAIKRAKKYIDAGSDAIAISSNCDSSIITFANKLENNVPIILIAVDNGKTKEDIFYKEGVNLIIYSNSITKAIYPAMINVAQSILENRCEGDLFEESMSIDDISNILPR